MYQPPPTTPKIPLIPSKRYLLTSSELPIYQVTWPFDYEVKERHKLETYEHVHSVHGHQTW